MPEQSVSINLGVTNVPKTCTSDIIIFVTTLFKYTHNTLNAVILIPRQPGESQKVALNT